MKRLIFAFFMMFCLPQLLLSKDLFIIVDDNAAMNSQSKSDIKQGVKSLAYQRLATKEIMNLRSISLVSLNSFGIKEFKGSEMNAKVIGDFINTIYLSQDPFAGNKLSMEESSLDSNAEYIVFVSGSVDITNSLNSIGRASYNLDGERAVYFTIINLGEPFASNQNSGENNLYGMGTRVYNVKDINAVTNKLNEIHLSHIKLKFESLLYNLNLMGLNGILNLDNNLFNSTDQTIESAEKTLNNIKDIQAELAAFAALPDIQKAGDNYVKILRKLFDEQFGLKKLNQIKEKKYYLAKLYSDYNKVIAKQNKTKTAEIFQELKALLSYLEGLKVENPKLYTSLYYSYHGDIDSLRSYYERYDSYELKIEKFMAGIQDRLAKLTRLQNEVNNILYQLSIDPIKLENSISSQDVVRALRAARTEARIFTKGDTITYEGTHLIICEDEKDIPNEMKLDPLIAKHIVRCDGTRDSYVSSKMDVVNNGTIINLTGGRATGGVQAQSFTNNGKIIKSAIAKDGQGNTIFTLIKDNGELISLVNVKTNAATGLMWAKIDKSTYAIFDKGMKDVYIITEDEIRLAIQDKSFLEKAGIATKIVVQGGSTVLTTIGGSIITLFNTLRNQDKSLIENRETLDRNIEIHMGWLKNSWIELKNGDRLVQMPKAILPVIIDIGLTLK